MRGFIAWATATRGLNVSDNCVVGAPTGVALFNATASVDLRVTGGGFRAC